MQTIAVVAAVVLGVAFLVAGGAKIAAGPAWPEQARDLGAPRIVALVLPWLEIVVGAALVTQLATPVVAVIALAMLLAFSGAIAVRLSQGRRPVCACFGRWSATPIGPSHLIRNAFLIALAVLALSA